MINPIEIKLALLNNRAGLIADEIKQKLYDTTGHYPSENEFRVAITRLKDLGLIKVVGLKYYSINKKPNKFNYDSKLRGIYKRVK